MSNSLKVEPVKIDEKLLNKVEHGIWEFPSLHLIVGKIASGKSTFLHNIITRFYEPVFKQNIIPKICFRIKVGKSNKVFWII